MADAVNEDDRAYSSPLSEQGQLKLCFLIYTQV